MRVVQAFAALIVIASALCKPITGACQGAVASLQAQPPTVSSATPTIDTASRLDGRLFFSAAERQRMDQARKRGMVVNDDGNFVEAPPNVLNGFVKRSDGNTVVWVDGSVRWNAQTEGAQNLVPSNVGGPASYVTVINNELIKPVETKSTAKARKNIKRPVKKIVAPRLLLK
ncbi:MAG: hypothetical protein ABI583_11210 [Betaproteobacteria bacterium]